MGEWKKLGEFEGEVVVWENEGQQVEGILRSKRSEVGKHGSNLYTIETTDGVKNIWGTAILDRLMEEAEVDQMIRITYNGEIQTKDGRLAKDFDVEVKE